MIEKNFVLRQFKTRILNTIEKVLKEYSKKELITEIKKIVGEISIPDELQKYLETLTTETTSEPAAPEQEQEGAADPAKTAANTLAPAANTLAPAANTLAPAAPDPAAAAPDPAPEAPAPAAAEAQAPATEAPDPEEEAQGAAKQNDKTRIREQKQA